MQTLLHDNQNGAAVVKMELLSLNQRSASGTPFKDWITRHVNFFQLIRKKWLKRNGKSQKYKEMVEDPYNFESYIGRFVCVCERVVSDKVVCEKNYWVTKLCERLCVTKLRVCVTKLYVTKLWCVTKLCAEHGV